MKLLVSFLIDLFAISFFLSYQGLMGTKIYDNLIMYNRVNYNNNSPLAPI
ncbi:MAG: hypothetical protein K940chlam5_01676 [Candidatus Anoxychlamydiales bacterium]|nr:hypothetical protein [Candidatus Anoxychlamydiales bacterium]